MVAKGHVLCYSLLLLGQYPARCHDCRMPAQSACMQHCCTACIAAACRCGVLIHRPALLSMLLGAYAVESSLHPPWPSHLVSRPHHDLVAWRLALHLDRATYRVNHHVLGGVLGAGSGKGVEAGQQWYSAEVKHHQRQRKLLVSMWLRPEAKQCSGSRAAALLLT